ncbi:hypothetical protein SCLCIDRAFT_1104467 [Scleroderma citrinum Foug A]|uniref:Uncharacterized protein n=1 Tax=Scleroderma citrinum Foug A TaxID=1036808 RepID=A0A0C2Z7T7_9AGAM|nr:hypothetical protein SCLCIDRAFT_1104467 [Scleroderma citrinum Foug A]
MMPRLSLKFSAAQGKGRLTCQRSLPVRCGEWGMTLLRLRRSKGVADTGSIDILLMHPKYFASSSNPDRHYIIPLPSTNYQYYTVNQPRRGDKRTLHSVCCLIACPSKRSVV